MLCIIWQNIEMSMSINAFLWNCKRKHRNLHSQTQENMHTSQRKALSPATSWALVPTKVLNWPDLIWSTYSTKHRFWPQFKITQLKRTTSRHPVISLHRLASPHRTLPTYVNVRCELPTPADRCGSAKRLRFHTLPLPSAGARGDTAKRAGCHRPLIKMKLRLCCSARGAGGHSSRWEVVHRRARSQMGIRCCTRKRERSEAQLKHTLQRPQNH